MQIEERNDGGIEITEQGQQGTIIIGRSTITGETMISLDEGCFYLFIHAGERAVSPIEKGDPSWNVGNYNHNQVDIGSGKAKIIREPDQIELFDRITAPLSIFEGLEKQLPAVIQGNESWRKETIEMFREESSLQLLKQLLE